MRVMGRNALGVTLGVLLLVAGSAGAQTIQINGGGCVDDVALQLLGSNAVPSNCTSNDVTFVLIGLGSIADACVQQGTDTVTMANLEALVRNTTAQTRYDVGLYVATDGDPNGDGAQTGVCSRAMLYPVGPAAPPLYDFCGVYPTCQNLLDLDGDLYGCDLGQIGIGDGPYLNGEAGGSNSIPDNCGDLHEQGNGSGADCDENADGYFDDTHFDFPLPITFPCNDPEHDGFINIPTCATWSNQANEVHDPNGGNSTCDDAYELVPGTKAKCRCEPINSDIPASDLGLTCGCSPTSITSGGTTTCTVQYANNVSCTPDLSAPEQYRCGTAAWLRFKVDYDETNGAISSPTSARGTIDTSDGSTIVWTPQGVSSSLGVIPQSDTDTLTFDYTVNPTAPNTTISFPVTSWWADNSSFTNEVQQTVLTCNLSFAKTPVTVASVTSRRVGHGLVVEWTTATEVANVGFKIVQRAADGAFVPVEDGLIPSKSSDSTAPQTYRTELPSFEGNRFWIEDVDATGKITRSGPFEVGQAKGRKAEAEAVDWAAIRAENRSRGERVARAARVVKSAPAGVRLDVDADALYRVTYEQLAAAGLDLGGVDSQKLALVDRGRPVPMRVEGGQTFGPGSFIEFWGEAVNSLYTSTNPYSLVVDPRLAQRVTVDPSGPQGTPTGWYLETVAGGSEKKYSFSSPTPDPWYDTTMLAYSRAKSWSFGLDVDHLVPEGAGSTLEVNLWGSTSWPETPDHHVRVLLNGAEVANETFDGRVARTIHADLPQGLVTEGRNIVTIELPADLGVTYDLTNLVDYRLTYPRALAARKDGLGFAGAGRVYQVSGFPSDQLVAYRLGSAGPTLLTGIRMAPGVDGLTVTVPGSGQAASYEVRPIESLATPGISALRPDVDISHGRADYLVISHPLFLDELGPLVRQHEAEGLTVRVVDVRDVYQQYGDGIVDPAAIRAYVAHAASKMGTHYVLLVGADTYDTADNYKLGSVSYIPTPYVQTDDLITFTPSDSLYGDIDGDNVQDVAVGRFPARTAADAASMVAKTLEYSAKDYGRTSVFAADAYDTARSVSFTADSESVIRVLPYNWNVERAYLDVLAVGEAHQRVLDAINRGVAITSFVGHSGPTLWTFSGLFSNTDAAALDNAGRPTVVLQWGCWNTYHVEPRFNTLGHAFMASGDRGAAAVLGSSTLLDTRSAELYAPYLMSRITVPGTTIGDAVVAAKQQLAQKEPGLLDIQLGWTVLGDPALTVEP